VATASSPSLWPSDGPLRPAPPPPGQVKDEELFLNYRLNPANGYPPWYVPVDPEGDLRRWQFK
jgi:hypothetical protein